MINVLKLILKLRFLKYTSQYAISFPIYNNLQSYPNICLHGDKLTYNEGVLIPGKVHTGMQHKLMHSYSVASTAVINGE